MFHSFFNNLDHFSLLVGSVNLVDSFGNYNLQNNAKSNLKSLSDNQKGSQTIQTRNYSIQ
jgi:hypothetical protein